MKQENTSENSHSDHFSPSIPLEETSLNQSFNMDKKNKKPIHFEVEKEQYTVAHVWKKSSGKSVFSGFQSPNGL